MEKFGVEMIGAKRDAIEMAEDRKLFREAMERIGLEKPKRPSLLRPNLPTDLLILPKGSEWRLALPEIGLPAIIRPAFAWGTGGGVAYNRDDYEHFCRTGMDACP